MFFDALAHRNRSKLGRKNLMRQVAKKFEALGNVGFSNGECLEIGPGDGDFARKCVAAGIRYTGLERSPMYQQRLVAEGLDVELGSAPPLKYGDQEFDLVSILTVLEHMPTFEEALQLIIESHRVLKPEGLLALEVPDFLRGGIDFYAWDYSHSFVVTELRLKRLLFDAGFQPLLTLRFTGSLSSPWVRWPIDIIGFIVHSRFVYWLIFSLGGTRLLERYHKTFEPAVYVVSRKT